MNVRIQMAWTLVNNIAGLACDLGAAGCEGAGRFLRRQAVAFTQANKAIARVRRGW